MKAQNFSRTFAREARLSQAAARDQVEETVRKILKKLQKGSAVKLPGLGKLVPKAR